MLMGHSYLIAPAMSLVPLFRASGINFTPNEDESRFQVSVRLPVGSSLEVRDEASLDATRIEQQREPLTRFIP